MATVGGALTRGAACASAAVANKLTMTGEDKSDHCSTSQLPGLEVDDTGLILLPCGSSKVLLLSDQNFGVVVKVALPTPQLVNPYINQARTGRWRWHAAVASGGVATLGGLNRKRLTHDVR